MEKLDLKGKKYLVIGLCLFTIQIFLPHWVWSYCARLIHCHTTDYIYYPITAIATISIAIFYYKNHKRTK